MMNAARLTSPAASAANISDASVVIQTGQDNAQVQLIARYMGRICHDREYQAENKKGKN